MVKLIEEKHRKIVDRIVMQDWCGPYMITRGMMKDTRGMDGFIMEDQNHTLQGFILYEIQKKDSAMEIVVLDTYARKLGIGTKLLEAARQVAVEKGLREIWLATTNDNIPAIRFYQKRGFDIREIRYNELERIRKIKDGLPTIGYDDIPIRHEIEFVLFLECANPDCLI